MTHTEPQRTRGRDFLIGTFAGGILGTALAFYFAPRLTTELRTQVGDSARRLRRRAADELEQVTSRVSDAIDQVAKTPPAARTDAGRDDVSRPPTPGGAL